MDSQALTSLATSFLQTPQGEKFLSRVDGVNVEKIRELTKQKALLETDKRLLTPEEKKELRKLEKEQKTAEAKNKLGEEIAKFTPYIKVFTTKGRVFDKTTQEPAVGVEVKPQLVELN